MGCKISIHHSEGWNEVLQEARGCSKSFGDCKFSIFLESVLRYDTTMLENRKEYKVVVLNGCASHVLPQSAGVQVNGSSTFSPHRVLFRFAEFTVHRLLQMIEGTISNFILRVDVMQRANGNFVVNEFESFEAVYLSSSTKETHKTQTFFEDYWRNVFFGDCLLGKLIND